MCTYAHVYVCMCTYVRARVHCSLADRAKAGETSCMTPVHDAMHEAMPEHVRIRNHAGESVLDGTIIDTAYTCACAYACTHACAHACTHIRTRAGELALDGIIIETTGLADPAPVAQTFFVNKAVEAFARLDGIVTLVDAKHIEQVCVCGGGCLTVSRRQLRSPDCVCMVLLRLGTHVAVALAVVVVVVVAHGAAPRRGEARGRRERGHRAGGAYSTHARMHACYDSFRPAPFTPIPSDQPSFTPPIC